MSVQDKPAAATRTPGLALVAIVALVIAGLATFDRYLSKAQDVEVQRLAQQSYFNGLRLRKAGKNKEALEAFRKAHALERRNNEYELELVDALIAADKFDQAELLIRDILERQPNNGRANLLDAHLMIAEGRIADAESYYHRAIYGEWPDNPEAHRIAVRMELADFLAARHDPQQLLAELLPLQEEVGKNPAIELHLAQLFLNAGSASRAEAEYRAAIKQNRKDAAAYLGLGEAELQLGDYRVAQRAFATASTYRPGDPSIQQRVELSDTLASLDPTSRKLPSMEKYRRSLRILDLGNSALIHCIADHPLLQSAETLQLLNSANDVLTAKPRAGAANEVAEDVLGLAGKIWQARVQGCGAGTSSADEEALRLIMERLAE